MKKKQKDTFLEDEGDSYFDRNVIKMQNTEMGLKDPIINALSKLLDKKNTKENIELLEIGCGPGIRLQWISQNLNVKCYGIDPSKKAVEAANIKNVIATIGTADDLKFENEKFDIVVFGFCLYLCDPSDLFQIAKETDRILKKNGYIVIRDFFSTAPLSVKYKYKSNIFTHKMDYRKLFDWHPDYTCIFHAIDSGKNTPYTDDKNGWKATSIIRKNSHR